MSVDEEGESRIDQVLQLISEEAFADLQQTMRVVPFVFADHPKEISLDTLTATTRGHATDIAKAVEYAIAYQTGDVSAVVLISDGAHNFPTDPVRAIGEFGVPIHTFAIGAETESPRDLQMVAVESPTVAYVGQPVRARAVLRFRDLDGKVMVRVSAGGAVLSENEVVITGTEGRREVDVEFVPIRAGASVYEIEASTLSGEFTADNNRVLFPLTVRRDRARVEFVASSPSTELSFLQRILEADSTLTVGRTVLKEEAEFYGQQTMAMLKKRIAATDVVILHDPSLELTELLSETLARRIQTGVGLWVLLGKRSRSLNPISGLSEWLPISFTKDIGMKIGPSVVYLTELGRQHPALRSASREKADGLAEQGWARLPPIAGFLTGVRAKPSSEILLESEGQPIAVAGKWERSRTIVTTGLGLWRLDFLASGANENPEIVRSFWRNIVHWLTNLDPGSRVKIIPERTVFRRGEEVSMDVYVYDEGMTSILSTTEIAAMLDGQPVTNLQLLPDGRYQGSWTGLEVGAHTFVAHATWNGEVIGSDSVEVVIDRHSLELSNLGTDHDMLRQISAASEGDFWAVDDWDKGLRRLQVPPRIVTDQTTLGLGGEWWFLVILIAFLSCEWMLRKHSGML